MIFFKKKHQNHFKKVYTEFKVKFTHYDKTADSIITIDGKPYGYEGVDEQTYEIEPINEKITFRELISKAEDLQVVLPMGGGNSLVFKLQQTGLNNSKITLGEIYYYTNNIPQLCHLKSETVPKIYFKKNDQQTNWWEVNDVDIIINSSDLENKFIIAFTDIVLGAKNNVEDDDDTGLVDPSDPSYPDPEFPSILPNPVNQ